MKNWYSIKALAPETETTEITVYDEIGFWGVNAADFARDLKLVTTPKIKLLINSPGGSVIDALAIFNQLRASGKRVDVKVMGIAASAGNVKIADNCALLVPLGIPDMFTTYYAPAPYMETVNTMGLPFYMKQEPLKFNVGIEVEAQSNPLNLVTRPAAIIKLAGCRLGCAHHHAIHWHAGQWRLSSRRHSKRPGGNRILGPTDPRSGRRSADPMACRPAHLGRIADLH